MNKTIWWTFLLTSLIAAFYFKNIKLLAIFFATSAIALILRLIIKEIDDRETKLKKKRIEETARLLRKQANGKAWQGEPDRGERQKDAVEE
jgi:hypothetical protein